MMLGCAHSQRALCAPSRVHPSRCFKSFRPSSLTPCPARRISIKVHAAAGGGATDPYKVLGVAPDADSNAIQRAYRQKLWDTKADPAGRKRIEEAHTRIMMSALTARMKGGAVSSDIKYADREAFMPWAPRFFRANLKFIALVGALLLGASVYSWIKNVSTMVSVIGVGLVGNYIKQSAINPPPRDPEQAEAEKGVVGKNLIRAVALTAMATLPAYFCVTYLPYKLVPYFPAISDFLTTPLFLERIYFFLCTAAASFNWLILSFYR